MMSGKSAGMDPGLLAALSATPQRGGGVAHVSAAAAASEAGNNSCFRRSVDMGTLAHSGNSGRPGARSNLGGFQQQPNPERGVDREDAGDLLPELAAAYSEGLIRCSSQLEGSQASGQMLRQESYQYGGVPSPMDQAAALGMFQQQGGQEAFSAFSGAPQTEPGRYPGQVQGGYRQDALSGHPSYNQLLRQASAGGAYPSFGDLHAQGSGHLGSGYGQPQVTAGYDMGANDKQAMSSAASSLGYVAEHSSSGMFSAANNWQDAILSGGSSLREEEARSWGARSGSPHEELVAPSGQQSYEISPRTPSNYGSGLGIAHSQPSPIPGALELSFHLICPITSCSTELQRKRLCIKLCVSTVG